MQRRRPTRESKSGGETRDFTLAQFRKACKDRGFEGPEFMGYYKLPLSSGSLNVSVWNAGHRRRDQLAYLIREQAKADARIAEAK